MVTSYPFNRCDDERLSTENAPSAMNSPEYLVAYRSDPHIRPALVSNRRTDMRANLMAPMWRKRS
jgi:hypothetical protein